MGADPGRAWLEHKGEAPGPEQNTTNTGVSNALYQDIDGFAGAGKASFQHNKPDLHTKDEKSGNQRPDSIHSVYLGHVNSCTMGRCVYHIGENNPHTYEYKCQAK